MTYAQRERARKRRWDRDHRQLKLTYMVWRNMIQRCHNEADKSYRNYGARGIGVCRSWRRSFRAFLDDMGLQPLGFTIERINNDRGYMPSNCRWATRKDQQRNRRGVELFEHGGLKLSIAGWAEHYGLPVRTLYTRKYNGWPVSRWGEPLHRCI